MFKRISEKWSPRVLGTLQMSPMHFLALQRSLKGVSKKVLSETLRHLERDGLVTRRPELYQSAVEYSLTAVGQSLCTALEPLQQWAAENATSVEKSRQQFDAAHGPIHGNQSGSNRSPTVHAPLGPSDLRIMETTPHDPRSRRRSADGQRAIVTGEMAMDGQILGRQQSGVPPLGRRSTQRSTKDTTVAR